MHMKVSCKKKGLHFMNMASWHAGALEVTKLVWADEACFLGKARPETSSHVHKLVRR